MPTDVLILGGFEFTDFAVPEKLPLGGRQHMQVHKMPGGSRTVNCMGPDDDDRRWAGTLWGAGAVSQALTLDAMRRAGAELPYANGLESRTVVISEFRVNARKLNCIEYEISVTPIDGGDSGSGGSGAFGLSGLDDVVGSDMTAASKVVANVPLPPIRPSVSGAAAP